MDTGELIRSLTDELEQHTIEIRHEIHGQIRNSRFTNLRQAGSYAGNWTVLAFLMRKVHVNRALSQPSTVESRVNS